MRRPKAPPGVTATTTTIPTSFVIPLKNTAKPVAFPADFEKHIAPEFAMRYLCEIGATPTADNCRMVLKEMPLESCNITAAWRSRGGLADAIVIQPNGVATGGSFSGKIGAPPPPPVASRTAAGQTRVTLSEEAVDPKKMRRTHGRDERNTLPLSRRKASQSTSSMGRANPHKVSVFVNTVASALEPSTMETAARPRTIAGESLRAATDDHGSSGNANSTKNTARVRASVTAGHRPSNKEQNRPLGFKGNIYGRSQGNATWSAERNGNGAVENCGGVLEGRLDRVSEEDGDRKRAALAEARRKLLYPPKVDVAAIAAVQAAFARKFPFQKHGAKLADKAVRANLKDLIKSEGNARLIGLLAHYLFWSLLLPYAEAREDEDDVNSTQVGNNPSRNKKSRRRLNNATTDAATATATTMTDAHDDDSKGKSLVQPSGGAAHTPNNNTTTNNKSLTPLIRDDAETPREARVQLTREETEGLFVAVVEAWSTIRSSLGTSRRAKLTRLPIVAATVRNGVQTVLCNCYPFLERAGEQGKRLLAALHEEVATRFIPRFYYEGPFTPAAEEEHRRQSTDNNTQTKRTYRPPLGVGGGRGNFLDASPASNSVETMEWKRHFGAPAASGGAPSGEDSHEAPRVIGAATKSARDHPADTRKPGEAFFTTSYMFRYVFPNPCSPRARVMVACKERARSSRHHCPTGGGKANVWESPNVDPYDGRTFQRRAAAASVVGQKCRVTTATASRFSAHGVAFGRTIGISEGLCRTRKTIETRTTGNVISSNTTAITSICTCSSNREQATAAQNVQETSGGAGEHLSSRRRDENENEELMIVPGTVAEGVGVGGEVRVGATAKARLYRGYCEQRAGDYEREYRRRGSKELLGRRFLLTR